MRLSPSRLARALAVAVVTAAVLSGCVKVHSTTTVGSDDLITQEFIFAARPSVLRELGMDPAEFTADAVAARLPEDAAGRIEVEDYEEGDLRGVRVVARGITLEEFNATTSVFGAGEPDASAPPEASEGPVGGALDDLLPSLTGAIGGRIAREGDEFLVTIPASDAKDGELPGGQFASAIDFAAVFVFPGPVIEASHGEVEGKTVTLPLEDLLAGEDITIRAVAQDQIAWGPIIQWGLIVAAALVIVGGATAFILADRARRREHGLPPPEADIASD